MAKQNKKGLSFFGKLFFLLNLVVGISLIGSYLASYVSPDVFMPLAFLGLAYPFLFLANAAFVIFWIISGRKQFLFSLIIILIGWNYMGKHYQLKGKTSEDKGITVMSYNVRTFEYHKWFKEDSTHKPTQMFDLIEDANPDILCFQEYYSKKSQKFDAKDSLFNRIGFKKYYIQSYQRGQRSFALTVFTKYKIIDYKALSVNDTSRVVGVYYDLLINEDTVRLFNLHLQSIQLGREEYLFTSKFDIQNTEDQRKLKEGSKKVLKKLKYAFEKRTIQAEYIADVIDESPYPVIVCGDFNDTPASYAYKTISSELNDAFRQSGKGSGRSYTGKFPSFRIDYILHSDDFESYNFQTEKKEYSDHFPVQCKLIIKQ